MFAIHRNSNRKLIPMTNDFMFHMVLQESNEALRGLVASFLHLPGDEIKSVVSRITPSSMQHTGS